MTVRSKVGLDSVIIEFETTVKIKPINKKFTTSFFEAVVKKLEGSGNVTIGKNNAVREDLISFTAFSPSLDELTAYCKDVQANIQYVISTGSNVDILETLISRYEGLDDKQLAKIIDLWSEIENIGKNKIKPIQVKPGLTPGRTRTREEGLRPLHNKDKIQTPETREAQPAFLRKEAEKKRAAEKLAKQRQRSRDGNISFGG